MVERRGDCWLIADRRTAMFLRVGTLTALVALADIRFANVWGEQPITLAA